jgi:PAS domain-containing protein
MLWPQGDRDRCPGGTVIDPKIDYQQVFRSLPYPLAVLSPDFTILDVNDEYMAATGHKREDAIGRSPFDLYPDRPTEPSDSAPDELSSSLEQVLAFGKRDVLRLARYYMEDPGRPGVFEERYWTVINTPVMGDNGRVAMIVFAAMEATPVISELRAARDLQG